MCLIILDRTSASSRSFPFIPPSVPSCNTELYVYHLFITRIPNSCTLEYHRYAVRLSLFILLSILPYCNTLTMMFVNSFDKVSSIVLLYQKLHFEQIQHTTPGTNLSPTIMIIMQTTGKPSPPITKQSRYPLHHP